MNKKKNYTKKNYRTAYKTPIGMTPYKLVYGKNCNLPVGVQHRADWAIRKCNIEYDEAGKERKLHLHELEELRSQAYDNQLLQKIKMKEYHDQKIVPKELHREQRVLLFNSRFKYFSGKLRSKWMGHYTITEVFPHGAVNIKDESTGSVFKVNGQRIKPFLGEDDRIIDRVDFDNPPPLDD